MTMTIGSLEPKQILDFSVELAREAGAITTHYFKGNFSLDRKADNSLVTIADREAERCIRTRIEQVFPDDAILGEEEGEQSGTSNRRWIIDPIDGTYAFVHGVPFYGVLIGVEIEDQACVGVVNLPALNEIIYAGRGLGCFWNGEPARVSSTSKIEEALLLTTDLSMCQQEGFGPAMTALQQKANVSRTWGDCYGHVMVATGRADLMLDPIMNVWDCAPLLPIMEEAGGTFTDWDGRPTIRGGNAVSTNGALFREVMKTIRNPELTLC